MSITKQRKIRALGDKVLRLAMAVLALALPLTAIAPASAAVITGTYTTGGQTTGTGPWTMTSTDSTFSVLRFVFDTPTAFSNLTDITVNYNAVLGGIGQGAPRLAVVVDTNGDAVADGSFDIQWGPAGTFVDPTLGAGSTGNLLALLDIGRYDLTGIGGSVYTDRAAALAAAGNYDVLRLSIIIDSFGGNDRNFIISGISAAGVAAVPLPATLWLTSLGLLMLTFARRGLARLHA